MTVISVSNVSTLSNLGEDPNLCVWVQVEFSRYHQEFRTKYCSSVDMDESVFHETCVVSNFPADLFNGTKISFRVIDNTKVVAEAVHIVLGLPPSFPRNEIIELQDPGIVQVSIYIHTIELCEFMNDRKLIRDFIVNRRDGQGSYR